MTTLRYLVTDALDVEGRAYAALALALLDASQRRHVTRGVTVTDRLTGQRWLLERLARPVLDDACGGKS